MLNLEVKIYVHAVSDVVSEFRAWTLIVVFLETPAEDLGLCQCQASKKSGRLPSLTCELLQTWLWYESEILQSLSQSCVRRRKKRRDSWVTHRLLAR